MSHVWREKSRGHLGKAGGWEVRRGAHWSTQVTLTSSSSAATSPPAMEVEVKIRLPNRDAYDKLTEILGTGIKATHEQENYFFDGPNRELGSTRTVLRLRFYNGSKKAVITVKGEQLLKDGIGRASEVEEFLADAADARMAFLPSASSLALPSLNAEGGLGGDPSVMLTASPLLRSLNERWGLQSLVCLGGFRNLRKEYAWEGETLELDETYFAHGTLYEVEIETSEPEKLRDKMEGLLTVHGISYSYSSVSKFANFIKKTLD